MFYFPSKFLFRFDVNCFVLASFLQIFLVEHFRGYSASLHRSKKKKKSFQTFMSNNIVLRWIDHHDFSYLRIYYIDDSSSFIARPYTIVPKVGRLPHFYRNEFRSFTDIDGLSSSPFSWSLFLRPAKLPYFVEDDKFRTVLYYPQRIM